jgi:hypothetical protein
MISAIMPQSVGGRQCVEEIDGWGNFVNLSSPLLDWVDQGLWQGSKNDLGRIDQLRSRSRG